MSHESVTIKRNHVLKYQQVAWDCLAVGEPFTLEGSDVLCQKTAEDKYVALQDVEVPTRVGNPKWRVCPCVMTITWTHRFITA